MDDYSYATLGGDGWLRCDGLHHHGFPTLLRDVLHPFGFTGSPAYRGRLYHKFICGYCEIHVDIPSHPSDPSLIALFTTATGNDLNDMLQRAAHLCPHGVLRAPPTRHRRYPHCLVPHPGHGQPDLE
jgi:hypothetical protein